MKRCVILSPDGTENVLSEGPKSRKVFGNYRVLKNAVGGPVEFVRILREDMPGHVFTYMVVNESGLVHGLPRNQRATDLYLAHVRRQFPKSSNPSLEAKERWRAEMESRYGNEMEFVSTSPEGYDDDPYVAGTVVWFDGWTVQELDSTCVC